MEGPLATLMLPNATGGANWQGGSLDPETEHPLHLLEHQRRARSALVPPDPERSDMAYVAARRAIRRRLGARRGLRTAGARRAVAAAERRWWRRRRWRGGGGLTVQGLPLVKPPYGRITAIDLNKGEIVWQIAHGETPDNIKNHPALKGLTIPRTGRQGRIGMLVTKTLVIAGEGGFFTTPNGQRGAMLRAYDKATGEGSRRGLHAGAADRIADDLHAQRQAVHHRRRSAVPAIRANCWSSSWRTSKKPEV